MYWLCEDSIVRTDSGFYDIEQNTWRSLTRKTFKLPQMHIWTEKSKQDVNQSLDELYLIFELILFCMQMSIAPQDLWADIWYILLHTIVHRRFTNILTRNIELVKKLAVSIWNIDCIILSTNIGRLSVNSSPSVSQFTLHLYSTFPRLSLTRLCRVPYSQHFTAHTVTAVCC